MRDSLTHTVGCSPPRLTPDHFSFTHVRNQMPRCVVAAAAAGEPLCSKVIPPLPSPCKGCPWPGHLQTSSLDPLGSPSPHQPGEPQAFPAEAAHSRREERSRHWGCPSFLSRLPGTLSAATVSSSSCPAFARCNPKLGISCGPAHWLPSPKSFPPTRNKVASIYLARGCLGFICLAETRCWVGHSWMG